MSTTSISISEFKAKCLDIVREVQEKETVYVITKHGKAVAQVNPLSDADEQAVNPLKNSILFEGDIMTPIGEAWDSE